MGLLLYTHPNKKDTLGFHFLCVCLCTVCVGVHGSCTGEEAREQPCLLPCLKQGFLFPAPTPGYPAFSSLLSIPPSYLRSTTVFADTFTWLGDPNAGPQTCRASSLPTEPFLKT